MTRAPWRSILMTAVTALTVTALAGMTGAPTAEFAQAVESGKKAMTKTATGLQYADVKPGDGETPEAGQMCIVDYTGWLWENDAKGKEFDDSRKRGEPLRFRVGMHKVIAGWDEGVATMKIGGRRELLIPPDLGYGERGAGGVIPPNATLFFDVELLGVMTKTKSGLEYRDIKTGTGTVARRGQTCVVHYTGWLWQNTKGKKFDSSLDAGQPFSFPVGTGQVIPGWDEGVAGMKVGGKRELLIPPDLGYGVQGFPPAIPRNATLFFEVELIAVK